MKMSSCPCNKSCGFVMCLLIAVCRIAAVCALIYSLGPSCVSPNAIELFCSPNSPFLFP